MASGAESAKEERYHNLTNTQREQILGLFIYLVCYFSTQNLFVVPKLVNELLLTWFEINCFSVIFVTFRSDWTIF